jgi:hypothetical protein
MKSGSAEKIEGPFWVEQRTSPRDVSNNPFAAILLKKSASGFL